MTLTPLARSQITCTDVMTACQVAQQLAPVADQVEAAGAPVTASRYYMPTGSAAAVALVTAALAKAGATGKVTLSHTVGGTSTSTRL